MTDTTPKAGILLECPHGVIMPNECARCVEEIAAGMRRLEWDSGTLPTHELNRVLTDAIADLWRDSYRRGMSRQYQRDQFSQRLRELVRAATGHTGFML